MFSNLTFFTKKHLDFLDWQIIASLIYTGKHITEEGRELIIKISQRMNNYRISTFKQGATNLNKDNIDQSLCPRPAVKKFLRGGGGVIKC